MNVIVTGGAGFIGSHLCEALLKKRHNVVVFDDLSTGRKENLPEGVTLVKGDICDVRAVARLARHEPAALFHQAAQISVAQSVREPIGDAEENILGTLNVIALAKKTGAKLMFASSGGTVYGEVEKSAAEDHPLDPQSPYGLSKLTAEHYIQLLLADGAYQILRYANVYGPRQDPHGEAGVVAIFSLKMLRGKPCTLNGGGVCQRDYVYVGDVVAANLLALKNRKNGIYNVGTGRGTSVRQLYTLMNRVGGFNALAEETPYREGDLRRAVVKITRAKRELGYQPATALRDGVAKTIDWFREQVNAGGRG